MSLLLCIRRRTSRAVHTYAARCCAALVRHKKRFASAAQRQCERHHRNTWSYSRAAKHRGVTFSQKWGYHFQFLPSPTHPIPSVPIRSHSLPSIPSRLEVGPLNRARGTGGSAVSSPQRGPGRSHVRLCISAQLQLKRWPW